MESMKSDMYHRRTFANDRTLIAAIKSFVNIYNRQRLHARSTSQSPNLHARICRVSGARLMLAVRRQREVPYTA
jgi:hypothetical protein